MDNVYHQNNISENLFIILVMVYMNLNLNKLDMKIQA